MRRQRPRGPRRWWWIGTLATLVLVLTAGVLIARNIGYWLVVVDPLAQARAVVVLGGDYPFRAMEAATIYREGWAPEVWLQRSSAPAKEAALRRLGFETTGEERPNRELLVRLGVPGESIRVLTGRARNTREEVELVWQELERVRGSTVILVTSRAHSRRLRATWRSVAGSSAREIVRVARDDPFEAGAWWRSTGDALAVLREVLGLLNVWAGFPVRPVRLEGVLGGLRPGMSRAVTPTAGRAKGWEPEGRWPTPCGLLNADRICQDHLGAAGWSLGSGVGWRLGRVAA